MRAPILTLAAVAIVAAACGSDDSTTTPTPTPVSKIVTFKANLAGTNEVPANASTGTGTFTATLDTSTNVFTYDVVFSGLSANVTLGHIHGPALAGANAGTTINFASLAGATFTVGATSGTAHGVTTLNAATPITSLMNGDSLKKLLFAGLAYANIHTSTNPGGEIRGQIIKQ
jgi:hypothetical protein